MELMSLSLASALKWYPDIPSHIKNTILQDVALGLCFLHDRTPPIIHRDLTANNVLLSESMRAKIADLGVARIVDMNPAQMSARMTATPGTPSYMPPEAFVARPVYDAKLDVFCLGNLVIHVAIREWPIPLVEMHRPNPDHAGDFTLVTEIERRADYLDRMGECEPLRALAIRCLQNDPRLRPHTSEIVQVLNRIVSNNLPPFANSIEMLHEVSRMSEVVGRKSEEVQHLQVQLETLLAEKQKQESEHAQRKAAEKKAIAEHNQMLQNHIKTVKAEKAAIASAKTSEVAALTEQVLALNLNASELSSLLHVKTHAMQIQQKQLETVKRELDVQQQQVETLKLEIASEAQQIKRKKHEFKAQQTAKDQQIQSLVTRLSIKDDELATRKKEAGALEREIASQRESRDQDIASLQEENALQKKALQEKDSEIAVQRERIHSSEEEILVKASEIAAMGAVLKSKEKVVNSFRKEVEVLRCGQPTLVSLFHPQASLEWQQCSSLPVGMKNANAVLLKNKVYVHGDTPSDKTSTNVYSYDLMDSSWAVTGSPTRWSALTDYRSELVLVGGKFAQTGETTEQLWVLGEDESSWEQSLPLMLTARWGASAISMEDYLVVVGGALGSYIVRKVDSVEVFNGQQWMKADPLPKACYNMKSTCYSGMYYLIGGENQGTLVFYAPMKSLIEKATSQHLPSSPSGNEQQSIWATLPDVPNSYSSTTVFGGALVALRGYGNLKNKSKSVIPSPHMYSTFTRSWFSVGTMPVEVHSSCTITLPTGEVMVIGGETAKCTHSNLAYIASLTILPQ